MTTAIATSFADLQDLAKYQQALADGLPEAEALKQGDNGIGFTGLKTSQDRIPMCALPPEDWKVWGNKHAASGKRVRVRVNGRNITGVLGDTMPSKDKIKNGAGIDLNPAFVKQLGLKHPVKQEVQWEWADGPPVKAHK